MQFYKILIFLLFMSILQQINLIFCTNTIRINHICDINVYSYFLSHRVLNPKRPITAMFAYFLFTLHKLLSDFGNIILLHVWVELFCRAKCHAKCRFFLFISRYQSDEEIIQIWTVGVSNAKQIHVSYSPANSNPWCNIIYYI